MSAHHGEIHAIGQGILALHTNFMLFALLIGIVVVYYIILYTHNNSVVLSNNEHAYVCTAASFEL